MKYFYSRNHPENQEHSQCLSRRSILWKEGRIHDLIQEERTIQKYLPNYRSSKTGESCLAIRFAQLMSPGKIQAALQLLSEDFSNSLLNTSEFVEAPGGTNRSVMELLEEKHPDSQPASTDSLGPIIENVPLIQSLECAL